MGGLQENKPMIQAATLAGYSGKFGLTPLSVSSAGKLCKQFGPRSGPTEDI